jgi:tRNA-dihydrouridine synthase A
MMAWTDRHCRYFHRRLAPPALLHTEMIVARAIVYGRVERLLAHDPSEQPLVLQLGGSDPEELHQAARLAVPFGFAGIDLNVGCPSPRASGGGFGACLMRDPGRVAECVRALIEAVPPGTEVSLKCRLGVDEQDTERDLDRFVSAIAGAGCRVLTVHARKALLGGLDPAANRKVPPLDYERVFRLKASFPKLTIVLNGGLNRREQVEAALRHVDGVMIGRAAYQRPWWFSRLSAALHPWIPHPQDRISLLRSMRTYVEEQLERGERLSEMVRPWFGLFQAEPGGRRFRRLLSEGARKTTAGWETVERALEALTLPIAA